VNLIPPALRKKSDTSSPNEFSNDTDPISLFQQWFEQARQSDIKEPHAMSVATVGLTGEPDVRTMLLKGVDVDGFVFYTNLHSAKGKALRNDPRVALCFYWPELDKQVRIRGSVIPVSDQEADIYFQSRPRLSQISAWASRQSQTMRGYFELEAEVARMILRFGMGTIPRPPFWSGFRVVPHSMEFWIQKPYRRHKRLAYERTGDRWEKRWLYP
jgi:pyridoxamine 5'-phosphate oxidase